MQITNFKLRITNKIFFSITRLFLLLTIASVPFSIRTFFYDASSYASGMFFETTAIFLNLTEILLWLTLISFLINQISASFRTQWKNFFCHSPLLPCHSCGGRNLFFQLDKKKQILSILLGTFLIINLFTAFFAKDATLSLLFSFKILEGVLLVWLISQNILNHQEILNILIFLGLFESVLALRQFFLQHDVGLYFLGEPQLSIDTPGVAKMDIGEEKLLRSYGTFAHPNILAAFLVLLFFALDKIKWTKIQYLVLIPLFFTFSRGAFLAIFVGLLAKALNTKNKLQKTFGAFLICGIFGLLLYIFFPERFSPDNAIWARLEFLQTSWQIFWAYPFGIGNGNYLFYVQDFSEKILKPWEFQPVHNLYLLILNETGILGFLTFLGFLITIFVQLFKHHKNALPLFSAILVLGIFDHYFWDLDTGRWLFWIGIGIIFAQHKELKIS